MSQQLSVFARLWGRLGLATTRDLATRVEKIGRRFERIEKQASRVGRLLEEQEKHRADLAGTVADLKTVATNLQRTVAASDGTARLLALARKQDFASLDAMRGLVAELEQDSAAVSAHVEAAIAKAAVSVDPFPHVVIEDLLPTPFYTRILKALPPDDYWQSSGRSRDYWEIGTDVAPWSTEVVWRFVDRQVVDHVLRPRIIETFSRHLADYWRCNFGVDSTGVSYHTAEGRLQRRRKGYLLRPHLDPPHAAMTGLFYLARPDDDPRHGTSLYRPSSPLPAKRKGIYYPDEHGITLENVVTVPFQANTLLVWMTSLGTHGADLTASDVPNSIERNTYQFQLVTDNATRRRVGGK